MNDDGAGCSLARGAFVFVVPAPVVEPALAGEQVRIGVRIVVHHHQDFPGEIHALEVVPVKLRRLDAVTDEHQLGIVDGDILFLQPADGDVVLAPGKADALPATLEAPAFRELPLDADDVERLLPGAIGKCPVVSHAFEPRL